MVLFVQRLKNLQQVHLFTHLKSEVLLQSIEFAEVTGIPRFMVQIKDDLSFQSFHHGVRCSIPSMVRNNHQNQALDAVGRNLSIFKSHGTLIQK